MQSARENGTAKKESGNFINPLTGGPMCVIISHVGAENNRSTKNGPVVQLVRTLACHARGHEFESRPGRDADLLIPRQTPL